MSYRDNAQSDAREMVENFVDEIVDQLIDKGEASRDLFNDYDNGDSYHHESHVDRDYDLSEAAELLQELSDHEETDSGLWQGLEPRRAISCQATYTYGNAVLAFWQDLIQQINSDGIISDLLEKYAEDEADELNLSEDNRAMIRARALEVINE